MPTLPFVTYDVFTDRRFAGNPLAVVFDADALSDAQMQAVAREFNLSETIFIRTPGDALHAASVRIFTPGKELPFAGHPTIGGAIAIAERRHGRALNDVLLVLEEKIGLVRCAVKIAGDGASFAEFDAPKLAEEAGLAPTDETLASALGLAPDDIGFDRHIPTLYSAGVTFVCAPIASLDALARARATPLALDAEAMGATELFLYARAEPDAAHAFRARMFAPALGVPEDPATGSAAASLAGALARFESLMDGWHTLPILQGAEMGRPSLIGLEIELTGGALRNVRIGGKAVKVSEGAITV
ncbi:MAG: PhzF family phenazine biosynthesis isomerase [Alphaproteobacteria bacterium]|nr:PhzF family phenazine biosynthesis isomerase [Alphaproteobacteria bacterium]